MSLEAESQAVRLDRETILAAAQRIVGSEGLKKLTMRRIGTELGVDPTAVYRHFRSKDELLDRLAERMFSTEPAVKPTQSWQDQLRAHARHAFERYRAHPDLGVLLARQPDLLPPLVRLREQTLAALIGGAGLSVAEAACFDHLFENHVVGCGLFFAVVEHYADPRVGDADALRRAYALLPADEFPFSAAAAPYLFADADALFDRTTELLIEAVQRRVQPAPEKEEDGCSAAR
jgi:AcrR family transcriptional regulator